MTVNPDPSPPFMATGNNNTYVCSTVLLSPVRVYEASLAFCLLYALHMRRPSGLEPVHRGELINGVYVLCLMGQT